MDDERLAIAYEHIAKITGHIESITAAAGLAQAYMDEHPILGNAPANIQLEMSQAREGLLLELMRQIHGFCKLATEDGQKFMETLHVNE